MAANNLTKSANIATRAREIDFVSSFADNWQALMDIMGVSRPIKKTPGTKLKIKHANITLENSVGEGETIPYSLAQVTEEEVGDVTIEKYAKGVSIEAIKEHGYEDAIARTDKAMQNKLQRVIMNKWYTFLRSGELTNVQTSFQMALAMAKGLVLDQFKTMDKDCTEVVAFVNVQDFYSYEGAATISVQTAFGLQYVKDFMGYNTVFLSGTTEIPRGYVYATPVDNIVNYFVDPSDSEFAQAGLEYTTDGVTNLIGFHTQGNYGTAVSECFAIMGIYLFAEYLDGIAAVKFEASGSMGSLSVTSEAGTETAGDTKVTVSTSLVAGATLYYKAASGTAPAAPSYKGAVDSTWTAFKSADMLHEITNGYKMTVVEVNGTGQAIASGEVTVVSKT